MSTIISNPTSIPNLPWQERPTGCADVVWRYSHNPVISRNPFPAANSTFNSAIIPYQGEFAGIFRIDDTRRVQNLYFGHSRDGLDWQIDPAPIQFECADPEIARFQYRYDPRLCWLEDRYYITWCNGYHGPTIGVGYTFDFNTYTQMENALLPFNRNGVLFPRKINGKYVMLSRPSDNSHTPFGDIFCSESPDLIHWGHHRHVMTSDLPWAWTKVGAGPIPIETSDGWLLIFHGVLTSCNGFVYSMGAALLDLDQPWKVIARAQPYLLSPQTLYECVGDVPNVVFPCAALVDGDTGHMAIYYGGADTVVALAFTQINDLVDFIKTNN